MGLIIGALLFVICGSVLVVSSNEKKNARVIVIGTIGLCIGLGLLLIGTTERGVQNTVDRLGSGQARIVTEYVVVEGDTTQITYHLKSNE